MSVNLNDDDVLSMTEDTSLTNANTSTVDEVLATIQGYLRVGDAIAKDWMTKGVECKALQAQGGGWQKGKVRLKLEFIPDKPVSQLDDLRNNL